MNLPREAAVWSDDIPNWTRQDEFMARLIESTEHWGAVLFFAALVGRTKGSPKPPRPSRLFEHPDRPEEARPAKKPSVDPGDKTQIERFFKRTMKGGE